MKLALSLLILTAAPALGERVDCLLSAPCPGHDPCVADRVPLSFAIDRNQFAPAHDRAEPPRRKVTMVDLDGATFAAEPMLIGDVRGFWEDAEAMDSRIFTMQADGSAIYTEDPAGLRLTGTCEVTN